MWGVILETAKNNGWCPDGTSLVDDEGEEVDDWDCTNYASHAGQRVHCFDSEDICDALNKATIVDVDHKEVFDRFVKWCSVDDYGIVGFEIH